MADDEQPNWGKYASVGLEVAVGVGLGVLVGWWIDTKLNSKPWGMTIGAAVGLAGGLYLLIKAALKMNR